MLALASLFPLACAHRPLAVLLSFDVCPVTHAPDGRDVNDGGVNVVANVSTDITPGVRAVAHDHLPGACAVELAPGGLPLITCTEPHVGIRYVLAWTRPKARALVLERREYPIPAGATPTARRPIAELPIDRTAWIKTAPQPTCGAAP